MKKRRYRTLDGGEVELEVPETEAEIAEVKRKMRSGEVDDSHAFSQDGEPEPED